MDTIIDRLLQTDEPSIRFKVLVHVLGRDPQSRAILELREEISSSARVQGLLSERQSDGSIPRDPYAKWHGAHWVLAQLADIGYPPGDADLFPLREQVLDWLLGREHWESIRTVDGRSRVHASQEGNALYALLALGLADDRADELAHRLIGWQWFDGGWNCDRHPEAINSSFHESLIPMRGLALHGQISGNQESMRAAEKTAEIFLKRQLFRRERGGQIIRSDFTKLCYPPYWHYDILFGLKVMAEAGFIGDSRCKEALDLIQSKRLSSGGWPAEKKYYRLPKNGHSGNSPVDWGGASKQRLNEWVTADALYVLQAAGRL